MTEPAIEVVVQPKSEEDEARLRRALAVLAARDPNFRFTANDESSEVTLCGHSEAQLDVLCQSLKSEFSVAIDICAPQPVIAKPSPPLLRSTIRI